MNGGVLVVRTAGAPPAGIQADLRRAVWSVDPQVPIHSIRSFTDVISDSVSQPRFVAWLLAGFGALALILGAVGIYGVMAYVVGLRTRELGVRMAVGATRADLGRLVLGDALRITAWGGTLGILGAAAAAQLLRTRLHEVAPLDPVTFAASAVVLGVVAVLAAAVPALRAMRTGPLEAISRE